MPLLDPKYLAAKQGLVSAVRALQSAVAPAAAGAADGDMPDPGGRLREMHALLDGELAKLTAGRFRIGIFGLVKAGKSTLINALAEEYVSEVDTLPATTAALHLVRRTGRPLVHFLPAAGKPAREADKAEVLRLLDEKGNPDNVEGVDFVDYPVDLRYLEEDVVLVDTPGLGYLMRRISARSDRELHSGAHAVVLVLRLGGGQPWQRDVREFLHEAVQRVPRVFVVINCNDANPEEWGEEPFRRVRERFLGELRESGRMLRAAIDEGTVSVHFVSALLAAGALLRLHRATEGLAVSTGAGPAAPADAAVTRQLQAELEASRFMDFRSALSAFAAGDKRLWDDLRFRARALMRALEGLREAVRAGVLPQLAADAKATAEKRTAVARRLDDLELAIREIGGSVGLEAEDLIAEMAEKSRIKADEFVDETVLPAVERWIATSDTPRQLTAELQRLAETWRPQLQDYIDKRRAAFAKRLSLKIRSDLFHRLGAVVEIEADVPLALADVARLPEYDITDSVAAGLSRWLTFLLAVLTATGLWSWTGIEDATGRLAVAAAGFAAVLLLGRFAVDKMVAGAMTGMLRDRRLPAFIKGFFHEAAVRRLTETKADFRKAIRDGLDRRREEIAGAIGTAVGGALEGRRKELVAQWTAERIALEKKEARLATATEQARAVLIATDDALQAATEAAE